jgi:hypothetical protein
MENRRSEFEIMNERHAMDLTPLITEFCKEKSVLSQASKPLFLFSDVL